LPGKKSSTSSSRSIALCGHVRQRHPLYAEALLLCAVPGCPEGTAAPHINVAVDSGFDVPRVVSFERERIVQGSRLGFRWRPPCP
jgi:hypothetical protein